MTRTVFRLETQETGLVAVTGEVDVTNVEEFTQSVLAVPGPRPVILQLSRLEYLDSAGFAALDSLLAQGVIVVVLSPKSLVHKAAELMGLPFHDDAETARRVLQRG